MPAPMRRWSACAFSTSAAAAACWASPGGGRGARRPAAAGGLAIDYRDADAEELAAAGERFDAVLSMEVVEHVADPAAFIAVGAELVGRGGGRVLPTPT